MFLIEKLSDEYSNNFTTEEQSDLVDEILVEWQELGCEMDLDQFTDEYLEDKIENYYLNLDI